MVKGKEIIKCKLKKKEYRKENCPYPDDDCDTCPDLIKKLDPKQKPKAKAKTSRSILKDGSGLGYVSGKMFFYREDQRTGEPSFDDYVKYLKQSPSNEAAWIKALVYTYTRHIQQVQSEALKEMDRVIAEFMQKKSMTMDQYKILTMARLANIEAAQFLVQEDPEAIRLPFVQETMIKILREHRNTMSKEKSLRDIFKEWGRFLTKRSRKKIPFTGRELGRAVKLADKHLKVHPETSTEDEKMTPAKLKALNGEPRRLVRQKVHENADDKKEQTTPAERKAASALGIKPLYLKKKVRYRK